MWKHVEDLAAGRWETMNILRSLVWEPRDSGPLEDREGLALKLFILQFCYLSVSYCLADNVVIGVKSLQFMTAYQMFCAQIL